MADDEGKPAFPPPRPRDASVPYRAASAAPAEPATRVPSAASSSPVKVVHRPEPAPDSAPAKKPPVKLTPDEVRALLDVSGPGYRAPTSWRRGIILLPTGGAVWLVRRILPWPLTLLLLILWLALFAWEVRQYIVTSRRW